MGPLSTTAANKFLELSRITKKIAQYLQRNKESKGKSFKAQAK